MLQSCETLITKINEWQKAILELDGLSDRFLNSGDEKIKEQIDNRKKEIEKYNQEYLGLAYPELPDRRVLFWPEKEMLEEIIQKTGLDIEGIEVKNNHIVKLNLSWFNVSQFSFDFSLFHNLEEFRAQSCKLKKLPSLPTTIKSIHIYGNPDIEIPDNITSLNNLEVFDARYCKLKKLPSLPTTIKSIWIEDIPPGISKEEKQRIKKEYPNSEITF